VARNHQRILSIPICHPEPIVCTSIRDGSVSRDGHDKCSVSVKIGKASGGGSVGTLLPAITPEGILRESVGHSRASLRKMGNGRPGK
jgi:hypothetical protein